MGYPSQVRRPASTQAAYVAAGNGDAGTGIASGSVRGSHCIHFQRHVGCTGCCVNGPVTVTRELILGGQKSGKSRAAEARAVRWLDTAGHEALLVATAREGDAEMAERIARHRAERKARTPNLATLESGDGLCGALTEWSQPHRLIVVDCLTLWLTQLMLPLGGPPQSASAVNVAIDSLSAAARSAPGPLVFVSNEIGMGVAPLSAEARRFIDSLGMLHQAIAALCDRVTLMVAGCELAVRGGAVGGISHGVGGGTNGGAR